MVAADQKRGWEGSSRRRVPRFDMQAPLDVMVTRSGVADKLPARSTNIGERGIAAMIAGELIPGETVVVEIVLSPETDPLQFRAIVRYQDKLLCGLEFVGMSSEQRALLREWARDPRMEREAGATSASGKIAKKDAAANTHAAASQFSPRVTRRTYRMLAWMFLLMLAGSVVFWWRWNRVWHELESGLKNSQPSLAEKANVRVPPEVMDKLLVHRVEPAYPAEARPQNLQGIIALDVVVGRDGSVRSMHPLNGPDILARAAMDAMRWWKFEPYRVNGEPVTVETTLAVEFKY